MLALFLLAPALVSGLAQVSIEEYAFVPESVFVQPGDTVRWTNKDVDPHTTTSVNGARGVWNSGNMGLNKTYQFVFKNTGTYDYRCNVHTGMLGWVTVQTVTAIRPAPPQTEPKEAGAMRDARGRALHHDHGKTPAPAPASPAFPAP